MGKSEDWQDIKYREVFEDETRVLDRRLKHDSTCKIEDLEATLRNLYIMEGADQEGRGSLQDTVLAARIAAYEQFITQWKASNVK